MDFQEYQDLAISTAIYPYKAKIIYPALGLAGEAGEVCEKIKKSIRDKDGLWSPEDKEQLKQELGDVLWYVANLANDMFFDLEEIAQKNVEKLKSRKARGVIRGNGDNR